MVEDAVRPGGTVVVRYFAGAAAAAGTDEERVPTEDGATVGELTRLLSERHGPRLAQILQACSLLVNGAAGGTDRPVPDGAQVDVLPPFAGG